MNESERVTNDEGGRDPALREMLELWRAPEVPGALDARMLASFRKVADRRPWWTRLMAISVPVPLPVAVAALVLLVASAVLIARRPAAPVEPQVVGGSDVTLTADMPLVARTSLAGFQPVDDMNVTIVAGDMP